jgi:subtilisin family serine protease
VDYTHEDLTNNMWMNPGETGLDANGHDKATNGIDDDGDGYVDDVFGIDACNHDSDPMGDHYHGTFVAGIIGASGNNGKGIAGLNWQVKIMALKSHDASGTAYDSAVIECFEYVIQMKKRGVNVRITNNSYGGDENGQAIKDAIDAAGNLGILNVFCAQNFSQNSDVSPTYPACFDSPSILSVAATTSSDGLASFSNYGQKSVDLAAPGVNIMSTMPGNGYGSFSGTSFSTPLVAGTAALLLSVNPNLSVADLKSAILATVDLVPALTNKVASNGRLNVARALLSVADPTAPSIVTSALPAGNHTPLNAQVELIFTKPMDHASVESGFSVTPTISGTFSWANNDRTVTFVPSSPFGPATIYTAKLLGSAKDTNGITLDGNYNRVAQGTNWDDYVWTFSTTPANDDFTNAQPINGSSGTVVGSNVNGTRESGEPLHAQNGGGASIWFLWTAPNNNWVTFDTVGTGFDTLLAAYTGTDVGTLTPVASNDDYGNLTTSHLSFAPVAGTTYALAVDGKIFADINRDAPPMGGIVVNWYPTPPPTLLNGFAIAPNAGPWLTQVTVSGTNFDGVTNVLFGGVSANFTYVSGPVLTNLQLTATVPMGAIPGPITIQTPHGDGTSASNFLALAKVIYSVSQTNPALSVDWAGNGFVLEYATSLQTPSWQPVTQAPTNIQQRTVILLPYDGPSKFFRWRK